MFPAAITVAMVNRHRIILSDESNFATVTTTSVLDHVVPKLKCYYFLLYDRVADVSHYRKLKSRYYCTHPSILTLKLHEFFYTQKNSKSLIHKLFKTIKSFHVAIA